jgi:hypothetical protein
MNDPSDDQGAESAEGPDIPDPDGTGSYSLIHSFYTDADVYSDRDRSMFVAGFEAAGVAHAMRENPEPFAMTIHSENTSRLSMIGKELGRRCEVVPLAPEDGWWEIRVEAMESAK